MEKNSKYFLKHFVHIYTLKIDVIKVLRLVTLKKDIYCIFFFFRLKRFLVRGLKLFKLINLYKVTPPVVYQLQVK